MLKAEDGESAPISCGGKGEGTRNVSFSPLPTLSILYSVIQK
jgi:hypothetical protein